VSEDSLEDEVLSKVGMDRRSFIRKLLIGSAFAVPAVASFDMAFLGAGSADATTSNCTNDPYCRQYPPPPYTPPSTTPPPTTPPR
jgi:hypothetical protein